MEEEAAERERRTAATEKKRMAFVAFPSIAEGERKGKESDAKYQRDGRE